MNKIGTVLLLAAGDGTRFWPLSNKVLFRFLGKTLLEHQIEQLQHFTDRIMITANKENSEEIKENVNRFGTSVQVLVQNELDQGQAGAILTAKDTMSSDVLVLNANDYIHFDILKEFVDGNAEQPDLVIAAKKVDSYFPGGYVAYENGRVAGIIEKPGADNIPSNDVKLVVDYFPNIRSFLDILQTTSSNADDIYERALTAYIKNAKIVKVVHYENEWKTLKYPWHVLDMMELFLSRIKKHTEVTAHISPTAIISGEVYLGKNVKIGDHAKIVGPCFVDDNSIVGDYAMVRESHIGKNSLIGGYSEVTRSYLAANVMLHRNYVGDSVLSNNVLMGAGAITANFRFDENSVHTRVGGKKVDTGRNKLGAVMGQNAKIGVHCTLVPGVKVGMSTFIGPHMLVDKDIDNNLFVYKDQKVPNTIEMKHES